MRNYSKAPDLRQARAESGCGAAERPGCGRAYIRHKRHRRPGRGAGPGEYGLDLRVSRPGPGAAQWQNSSNDSSTRASSIASDVWDWFNRLTREEWVVVLAVVSVLGFLCMLGYGSRNKY